MSRIVSPIILAVLCCLSASLSSAQTQTPFERDCEKLAKSRGKDTARFQQLLKLDWDNTMRESPEFATEVGYPGQNARWSDLSLDAIARRQRELQSPLQVIQSIQRAQLPPGDQLSFDLFKRNLSKPSKAGASNANTSSSRK